MKTTSELVFACHEKSCAPPPAGKGGSSRGGVSSQRIRAYYKAHNQGFRDHYFSGDGPGNIYEHMARKFKMPIREIKRILSDKLEES